MSSKDTRYLELDGLRGFAAFSVFLSHAVGLYPGTALVQKLNASPLHILWDGAAAVFLFFTLSGFVLALPFLNSGRKLDYVSFITRRIFRLYPAFWFALLTAMLMRQLFNCAGMSGLSEWARSFWLNPVPLGEVLRHMTMILHADVRAIDPPVWSLATEMRASVVLPFFIIWLAYWRTPVSQTLVLASAIIVMWFSNAVGYLPAFVLGVLAAANYPAWKLPFMRVPQLVRPALWIAALAVYGNVHVFSRHGAREDHPVSHSPCHCRHDHACYYRKSK